MQVVDVNPLVYALHAESSFHLPCKAWLDALLESEETFLLTDAVCLAVIRVCANPRLWRRVLSPAETAEVILQFRDERGFIGSPRHPDAVWREFCSLCSSVKPSPNLVYDLHLAAAALVSEGTVVSVDRDFERVPGLRRFNPVSGQPRTNPR